MGPRTRVEMPERGQGGGAAARRPAREPLGFSASFSVALSASFSDAFSASFSDGFSAGFSDGFSASPWGGFSAIPSDGFSPGFSVGFSASLWDGFSADFSSCRSLVLPLAPDLLWLPLEPLAPRSLLSVFAVPIPELLWSALMLPVSPSLPWAVEV